MGGEGSNSIPNIDPDYQRLPSFMKVFHQERCMAELRLPPEFVGIHGDDLSFDCRLVWPNGERHRVRILKLQNGFYFHTGWPQFVRSTGIVHRDHLIFTLVDVGTFNVKRFDSFTHCPPQGDLDLVEDDDIEGSYSPDLDTSDDYVPSELEKDSSDSDENVDDSGALLVDAFPTFVIALTQTNINRTIQIPYGFWKRHIPMGALEAPVYLMAEGGEWRVTVNHNAKKIRVKHGWARFKHDNNLVEGVRCHFQLVDPLVVQFNVWFERP